MSLLSMIQIRIRSCLWLFSTTQRIQIHRWWGKQGIYWSRRAAILWIGMKADFSLIRLFIVCVLKVFFSKKERKYLPDRGIRSYCLSGQCSLSGRNRMAQKISSMKQSMLLIKPEKFQIHFLMQLEVAHMSCLKRKGSGRLKNVSLKWAERIRIFCLRSLPIGNSLILPGRQKIMMLFLFRDLLERGKHTRLQILWDISWQRANAFLLRVIHVRHFLS